MPTIDERGANWNVIGLTDLGGHLVESYTYNPYGELTVDQSTGFGDRDGDGKVDSTDKGTVGTTCTTMSGSCRILDLDFDGDYDSTDAGKFDSLAQGLQRNPGRLASAVSQPFAHQGLLFEPEIGSYQNRARQYDPGKRRFVQRDPYAANTDEHLLYSQTPHSYLTKNAPEQGDVVVTTKSPLGEVAQLDGSRIAYLHGRINCSSLRLSLSPVVDDIEYRGGPGTNPRVGKKNSGRRDHASYRTGWFERQGPHASIPKSGPSASRTAATR